MKKKEEKNTKDVNSRLLTVYLLSKSYTEYIWLHFIYIEMTKETNTLTLYMSNYVTRMDAYVFYPLCLKSKTFRLPPEGNVGVNITGVIPGKK